MLESCSLPPHRFFAVPMTHRRKSVEGYWWMHLPQPIVDPENWTTS
jgi:hypothetical protein